MYGKIWFLPVFTKHSVRYPWKWRNVSKKKHLFKFMFKVSAFVHVLMLSCIFCTFLFVFWTVSQGQYNGKDYCCSCENEDVAQWSIHSKCVPYIWCDFDRASSLICGNKMPTRCNRDFYCRSYCFLNMFRAPLCPSLGAQEYYTVVATCGISRCKDVKSNL